MFGYVTIHKGEMKVKNYEAYRAAYCGICKTCGRKIGLVPRLCTSYDMTFLCLVLLSVTGESVKVTPQRCILRPFSKRPVSGETHAGKYTACAGVMLSYLKLRDDWRDEKKFKAVIGMMALRRAVGKARKEFPALYNAIEKGTDELSELERQGCESADTAADVFARITSVCFTPDFIPRGTERQLYWLGYYIGRWVYLIDAINDLESDIKKGNYNPYAFDFSTLQAATEFLQMPMTLTLESAAAAYELLDFKENKELLDNIIYLGLPRKQAQVFEKRDCNNNLKRNGVGKG